MKPGLLLAGMLSQFILTNRKMAAEGSLSIESLELFLGDEMRL
jgi:hypothetical protein